MIRGDCKRLERSGETATAACRARAAGRISRIDKSYPTVVEVWQERQDGSSHPAS